MVDDNYPFQGVFGHTLLGANYKKGWVWPSIGPLTPVSGKGVVMTKNTVMSCVCDALFSVIQNHATAGKFFTLADTYMAMDDKQRTYFPDADLDNLRNDIRSGLVHFNVPELVGCLDQREESETLDLLVEMLTNKVLVS